MKRKTGIILIVVAGVIALNFLFTKRISQWVVSSKHETTPEFNETIRKAGFISWIEGDIKNGLIPKFPELFTEKKITNPLITKDYVLAGSFIDFVITKYGYDVIINFIKSPDFAKSFGKTEPEVREEWIKFLTDIYKSN